MDQVWLKGITFSVLKLQLAYHANVLTGSSRVTNPQGRLRGRLNFSRLPITRTFWGNQKRFELSGVNCSCFALPAQISPYHLRMEQFCKFSFKILKQTRNLNLKLNTASKVCYFRNISLLKFSCVLQSELKARSSTFSILRTIIKAHTYQGLVVCLFWSIQVHSQCDHHHHHRHHRHIYVIQVTPFPQLTRNL